MKSPAIRVGALLGLAAVTALLTWRSLQSAPEQVDVAQPCNTFVSEFAPVPTPQLRPGNPHSELLVSFTPAEDKEASAVVAAVKAGTRRLVIQPVNVEAEALRIEDERLVLRVRNKDHAAQLLRALCFKEPLFNPGK